MKRASFFGLIILLAVFLFRTSFFLYFSQDDFFRFKMGRANNLTEFLSFFSFKNSQQYGFYRPLTINLYSFFGQKIFGDRYIYYRAFNFGIFIFLIFLVYQIFNHLLKSRSLVFGATFFYSLSAIHLTSLSYLSASEEIIVAFFYFLSIILYLKKKSLAIFVFFLALLSRETAITLPLILFALEFCQDKNFRRLWIYFLTMVIYFSFRVFFHLVPDAAVYEISFSLKNILNNYFWFFSWGLGAPESLVDFVGSGLKLDPRFLILYPPLPRLIFIGLFSELILTMTILVKKVNRINENLKHFLFFIFWFIVTLSPFVFLLNHRFAFYLEIPLFGLAGVLALIVCQNKFIGTVFVIVYFGLALATTSFYTKTYWAINRSMLSKKIFTSLKKQYPVLPKGATINFLVDSQKNSPFGDFSQQAKIALSDCDGPRFVYNDYSLNCYFVQSSDESSDFFPLKIQSFMIKLD